MFCSQKFQKIFSWKNFMNNCHSKMYKEPKTSWFFSPLKLCPILKNKSTGHIWFVPIFKEYIYHVTTRFLTNSIWSCCTIPLCTGTKVTFIRPSFCHDFNGNSVAQCSILLVTICGTWSGNWFLNDSIAQCITVWFA